MSNDIQSTYIQIYKLFYTKKEVKKFRTEEIK